MHESHVPGRTVLLPKRLLDRVPQLEPDDRTGPIMAGPNTWGLAERIGALPGITTQFMTLEDRTTATDYFVDGRYVLRNLQLGPQLLCHIDRDGISLSDLGAMDKAEVMHKGWATGTDGPLSIFLPRDSIEMEIAWRIVLLAYQYLTSRPEGPRTRRKSPPILPKYSSAARYWM